jgi:hypothetical protein
VEGQDEALEAMENKIRSRVWSKKCCQLFKEYLKEQEATKNKELCRICSKKVDIAELDGHVNWCGRRTFTMEQLIANFEKRLDVIKKLELVAKDMEDQKDVQVIAKVVDFYRNISSETKNRRRRMSQRCKDAKLLLFFY